MIKWKEVRRAISSTIGKELEKHGFKNPSYRMYRHRDYFIDIVECYHKYEHFYIDMGCQPSNIIVKNNFRPWDVMFRGRVYIDEKSPLSIAFYNTLEEQECFINEYLPFIIDEIENWYSNFNDIDATIHALQNNSHIEARKSIIMSRKDSDLYNNAMNALIEIKSDI